MDKILSINLEDFINQLPASGLLKEDLYVIKVCHSRPPQQPVLPVRLNAILLFFCINGEISLSVDYREYLLTKNKILWILWINSSHIIDNMVINENLEGYAIIMSLQFAKSIINEVQGLNNLIGDESLPLPTAELEDTEMQCLSDIIERIIKIQGDTSHTFRSYIVRNEVSNLVLEMMNFKLKKNKNQTTFIKSEYKEEIALKFIPLVLQNCKEHHEVSFYAEKMCMTDGNLSRIMKAFSGKTAVKWINDVLVTEAQILLRKPNSTVQQVADELNFGDQSSFGKFFRKHTGMTPREYKKKIIKEKE